MKDKMPSTSSIKKKRDAEREYPEHPNFDNPIRKPKNRKTVEKRIFFPTNTVEFLTTLETTNENVVKNSVPQQMEESNDNVDGDMSNEDQPDGNDQDGDEAQASFGSQMQSESSQATLGAQQTRAECHCGTDDEVHSTENDAPGNDKHSGNNGDGDADDHITNKSKTPQGNEAEGNDKANGQNEAIDDNDDVGPIDKSLLRSFKFHRARLIGLGKEKGCLRVHHHPSMWNLQREPQIVQELNLLLDDVVFKSMKAGGQGNSLSMSKLSKHFAYKLEKIISDEKKSRESGGISVAPKKGLSAISVARAYMLYVLGSFLFPTKKGTDVSARYLDLFAKDKAAKKWSWGSAVLAHLYHNLGAASREDGKQFACCTTLLESWIFAHFPKLPGIPKEQYSDATEHCTCWKWGGSVTDKSGGPALLRFREALDNYKVEDVVWDPYLDKRATTHAFKEITYFCGMLASPDHVEPNYPNRVVRQFSRFQAIPNKPKCHEVSGLWTSKEKRKYTPKYEWADSFSSGKWKEWILKKKERGKRVREGPALCAEGYLEWFATVSWTKICPLTVDLGANDDGGLSRCEPKKRACENVECDRPVVQPEVVGVHCDRPSQHEQESLHPRAEIIRLEEQISILIVEVLKLKEDKEKDTQSTLMLLEALREKTIECDLLRETIDKMKVDLNLKLVLDELSAKAEELPGKLDAKILECKSLQEQNEKLADELRQRSGVEGCNRSLSVKLKKKTKEYESLKEISVNFLKQLERQLPPPIPVSF
ncbi:hypothetical protein GIB67_004981 [Kingdonia uniflora]|uniref:Aminotransferase-like plant mobile domain-containing protein n=1 Tax=Kingdonia uniflora TaxID=39325 RepID=A0A7J7NML3_9MAGN|nr:hypothetical protein GIB67_004981 [Kingdonia uniflora]